MSKNENRKYKNFIDSFFLNQDINFRILQKRLKKYGLPTATKLLSLKKKFLEINDYSLRKEIEKRLKDFYLEHIYYKNKAVFIFESKKGFNIDKNIFNSTYEIDNPYFAAWPFQLNKNDLMITEFHQYLTNIENTEDEIILSYCSKVMKYEKSYLSRKDLNPETQKKLNFGSEIIVRTPVLMQICNTITFNKKTSLLIIKIENISEDYLRETIKELLFSFYNFSKISESNYNIVNLFDMMQYIYEYEASQNGVVCMLGFECLNGASRNEYLRKEKKDLRLEAYHKAGKNAVGELLIYRIAFRWSDFGRTVELDLPGKRFEMKNDIPMLTHFIANVNLKKDYEFILKKVLKFINI